MTASFVIGSVFVLSSAVGVSTVLIASSRRRIRHTEALVELVRHIRTHIEYFLTPVDLIFSDFRNETLESCGFCPVLRDSGLAEALRTGGGSFSPETRLIAEKFASSLGDGYRDGQLRLCDFCISGLSEQLERERESYDRNLNMYRFVPCLLALFIILCFL